MKIPLICNRDMVQIAPIGSIELTGAGEIVLAGVADLERERPGSIRFSLVVDEKGLPTAISIDAIPSVRKEKSPT